jgi:hypothetical protein
MACTGITLPFTFMKLNLVNIIFPVHVLCLLQAKCSKLKRRGIGMRYLLIWMRGPPRILQLCQALSMLYSFQPIEKIISICQELEEENLNPRALFIATESSLQSGNIDQACALLHVMKDKNLPIRQHYFWPLLASHRKNSDSKYQVLLSYLTLPWNYQ